MLRHCSSAIPRRSFGIRSNDQQGWQLGCLHIARYWGFPAICFWQVQHAGKTPGSIQTWPRSRQAAETPAKSLPRPSPISFFLDPQFCASPTGLQESWTWSCWWGPGGHRSFHCHHGIQCCCFRCDGIHWTSNGMSQGPSNEAKALRRLVETGRDCHN